MAPAAAARIMEGLGRRPGGVVKLPSFGSVAAAGVDVAGGNGDAAPWSSCWPCCSCVGVLAWCSGSGSAPACDTSGDSTLSSDTLLRLMLGGRGSLTPGGAGMAPAAAANAIEGVTSRSAGVVPSAAGCCPAHARPITPTSAAEGWASHTNTLQGSHRHGWVGVLSGCVHARWGFGCCAAVH